MSILRSAFMLVGVLLVAAFSAVVATTYYFRPELFAQLWNEKAPATSPLEARAAEGPKEAATAESPAPLWPFAAPKAEVGGDVVTVARKVRPMVVLVQTLDAQKTVRSTGTGFFVSADGKFITNAHVVEGGKSFRIRRSDGTSVEVSGALAYHRETDLAVLQAKCTGVPFLAFDRNQPAEPGEKVVVIGSPLGLEGTVSDGIVSATRTVEGDQLIQITAALSPGSSGSPVLDLSGRLIGVATMASFGRAQSLNFAVPEKHVRAIYEKALRSKTFLDTASQPALAAKPANKGLSAKDIVIRLQAGFDSREVAEEVKQKGTVGAFPPDQLARIREVGGREDLLALCKAPPNTDQAPPDASGPEGEQGRAGLGKDKGAAEAQRQWTFFRQEMTANVALQMQRVRSSLASKKGPATQENPWSDPRLQESLLRLLGKIEVEIQRLIQEVDRADANAGLGFDGEAFRAKRRDEIRRLYQQMVSVSAPAM